MSCRSPFAAKTVLFPTNPEGKYEIAAEGIRLAFTTHGGALANLWMNDTHGVERDIVLGYESANAYPNYKGNPYLNGVIGVNPRSAPSCRIHPADSCKRALRRHHQRRRVRS